MQVKPAGVEADTDRLTWPVNPPVAVRVMVEVPEEPARIWVGETAPAPMVKSPAAGLTVTVITTPWFLVPDGRVAVPLITTV